MYLEEIRKENIYKYDVKGIDENTVEDIAELYNGLVSNPELITPSVRTMETVIPF